VGSSKTTGAASCEVSDQDEDAEEEDGGNNNEDDDDNMPIDDNAIGL
jgi:hypothetical protein